MVAVGDRVSCVKHTHNDVNDSAEKTVCTAANIAAYICAIQIVRAHLERICTHAPPHLRLSLECGFLRRLHHRALTLTAQHTNRVRWHRNARISVHQIVSERWLAFDSIIFLLRRPSRPQRKALSQRLRFTTHEWFIVPISPYKRCLSVTSFRYALIVNAFFSHFLNRIHSKNVNTQLIHSALTLAGLKGKVTHELRARMVAAVLAVEHVHISLCTSPMSDVLYVNVTKIHKQNNREAKRAIEKKHYVTFTSYATDDDAPIKITALTPLRWALCAISTTLALLTQTPSCTPPRTQIRYRLDISLILK